MALGDGIGRNKGRKGYAFQKGYKEAIHDMSDNLIRNSRTEIIDGKVTLIVTEDRIKTITEEMERQLDKTETNQTTKIQSEKEIAMNPREIGIILKYCHELSRLVSPADASRYGLNSFDGSVCDFLKDISYSLLYREPVDIHNDEFYAPIFENMKAELKEKFDIDIP